LSRVFRIGVRAMLVVTLLFLAYLFVTFLQVWNASNRDGTGPAEAIIVLGAAQYDGRPSPVLAARLEHAVELYEAGAAPTIVVTGGKQEGDRFTEAAAGFNHLRRLGVPEADILREENGVNTWEQLAAATRFLRERGQSSAILVSDDYHAYRLDRIAHELGLTAQVSPVDPNLTRTERIRLMTRETVAVAVGRIIGFRRLVDIGDEVSIAERTDRRVSVHHPPSGVV
jgi:uncharacterized SAM-binding protein YcdF (DUF218 family)